MSQRSASSPPKPAFKPIPPFDIDNYLNPFVPRNPLRFLPSYISYWFGYRSTSKNSHRQPLLSLVLSKSQQQSFALATWYYDYHIHTFTLYLSILIGAFCGVAIIENVFLALPRLSGHAVPIVVASFGAAAILEYNTIESPLAQPRNLVLGHFLSAVVGVGITKLFLLLSPDQFKDLNWIPGALAVGVASITMSFTKTVHPPAGATALLAATNLEIMELGWWLLPLVLLASMLMLASALVLNNFAGRRYPVYWWTPVDLKKLREERRKQRLATRAKVEGDVEGGVAGEKKDSQALSDADTEDSEPEAIDLRKELTLQTTNSRLSRAVSFSSADHVPRPVPEGSQSDSKNERREKKIGEAVIDGESVLITREQIIVPEWLTLSDWEHGVLRILMERIREHSD